MSAWLGCRVIILTPRTLKHSYLLPGTLQQITLRGAVCLAGGHKCSSIKGQGLRCLTPCLPEKNTQLSASCKVSEEG